MTLYFTIMGYVLLGHSISADKVFSMAQYFNILQLTMAILYPMAVTSAAEAAVSIKRIEVRKSNNKEYINIIDINYKYIDMIKLY